jgi:hypothetical protein
MYKLFFSKLTTSALLVMLAFSHYAHSAQIIPKNMQGSWGGKGAFIVLDKPNDPQGPQSTFEFNFKLIATGNIFYLVREEGTVNEKWELDLFLPYNNKPLDSFSLEKNFNNVDFGTGSGYCQGTDLCVENISASEEAKKKGKDHMIYGIIGFAVIVGVWGLVNIVTTTFGLKGDAIKPIAPQLVNSDSAAKAGSCPDIKAGSSKFADVIGYFTCLIDKTIIPFIFAIAMVFFIWGAVNFFIINANEESKRAQGRQFMLWAVIALAVMISVWGLVKILALTFGIDTSYLPKVKP